MKITPTLFRAKASSQTSFSRKGSTVGMSILALIVGLVLAVVFPLAVTFFGGIWIGAWGAALMKDMPGLAYTLWFIAAILLVVIPTCFLIYNLLRPTKKVICPKCSHKHKIFRSAKKYMCTSCYMLLLTGDDGLSQPQLSACSYCSLVTAVTEDHWYFACPNCGVTRKVPEGKIQEDLISCRHCSNLVPEAATFCRQCGEVLKDIFAGLTITPEISFGGVTGVKGGYDLYSKIGKDSFGHIQYVKAILHSVSYRLDKAESLPAVESLFLMLMEALESLEEALTHSETENTARLLLAEVDKTYAKILNQELLVLNMVGIEKEYPKGSLQVLITEPHLKARRRVEEILGDQLQNAGSRGRWGEKLVVILAYERKGAIKDEKFLKIKEFDNLKQEIESITQ